MWIYLLILAFILFLGVKIAPKGNFNEDFLSLKVSKGIQGFYAICIIAHHFVQPFVYSGQGAGALSIFAMIGFVFVGVFFFFSGYGLFKSYKTKPNYLKSFLRKRMPVVLVPLYIVNTILTVIVLITGGAMYNDMNPLVMGMDNIFFRITTFLGITLMNSNAWYMITIAIFYIAFFFAFKYSKNEDRAFKIMGIFSVIYLIAGISAGHGIFWLQGEWWYNSSILLFIGMYVAKNEEKVISFIKRRYTTLLIITGIGTIILTCVAIASTMQISYYRPGLSGKAGSVVCLLCESCATLAFVSFILILTMKVRLNNKILDFLGKISLEIYLVHRFFLVVLNSQYITIQNIIVYFAAVYAGTIITAIVLHKIDKVIIGAIQRRKSR